MSTNISALPRGTMLARYVHALAAGGGNLAGAAEVAAGWIDVPGVRLTIQKAMVEPVGSDALAVYGIGGEILELLKAESLAARLAPRMRTAPFRVKVAVDDGVAGASWVEEAAVKPITATNFDQVELDAHRLVAVSVVSRELATHGSADAEKAVRDSLTSALARALDAAFFGDAAPVAGVSPAGVAFGQPVGGSSPPDAAESLAAAAASLGSWRDVVWVLHPAALAALSSQGLVVYAGATPTILTVPVLTSPWVESDRALLLDLRGVVFGSGRVDVDVVSHGNITLDDGVSPATESRVSLWQANLVAVRCERTVSWQAAGDAVAATVLL